MTAVNTTVSAGQTSNGITLSSGDSLTVESGGAVVGGSVAAVYGIGGPSTVDNQAGGLISGGQGSTGAGGYILGGTGGTGLAGIDLTAGGTITNAGIVSGGKGGKGGTGSGTYFAIG